MKWLPHERNVLSSYFAGSTAQALPPKWKPTKIFKPGIDFAKNMSLEMEIEHVNCSLSLFIISINSRLFFGGHNIQL